LEYEQYIDDDPNVIGIAANESEDHTVVFISAPGKSLNWEHLSLFPTFDPKRVIVATPIEPLVSVAGLGPEEANDYLNNFLSEAILLAEEHFATAGTGGEQ
jgi:hypothetical protein